MKRMKKGNLWFQEGRSDLAASFVYIEVLKGPFLYMWVCVWIITQGSLIRATKESRKTLSKNSGWYWSCLTKVHAILTATSWNPKLILVKNIEVLFKPHINPYFIRLASLVTLTDFFLDVAAKESAERLWSNRCAQCSTAHGSSHKLRVCILNS